VAFAKDIVSRTARRLLPMPMRNVLRPYWQRIVLPQATVQADRLADLATLGERFAGALCSMYHGEPQIGLDGVGHDLHPATKTSVAGGMWLYHLCRKVNAQLTMEIGCAYGFSTLYFLAALSSSPSPLHIAIDPYESSGWSGIGVRKVQSVGMSEAFRLLEEMSIVAVPRLMRDGYLFDVIFIDDFHRFDDVLVDFTLSALVCKHGGYVVIDDSRMPSVRKAVSFVRRNRKDFAEVTSAFESFSVFQKVGEDQRIWTHFEDFD
jgi:predicted O-methyltransferase YrrM